MRASWFESKEKITLWHNPGYRGADIPDEFTNRSADKDIPLSQLYGFESTDKLNAKEHGDQVLSIAVKMKANMWNGDPIVVTRTTDGYMILDGHHRFAAAKKAGLESLPAIVVDASELEHRNDIPKAKVEEASGYIPTKAQAKDPRFSSALTVDIKPGETQRQAAKLGMKIDKKGSPPLLHATAAKNTSANKAYNLGLVESLQAKYDAIRSSNVNEESINENVSALQAELEQKYNLKSLFLSDMASRNAIELHSIIVNKEEQGSGTGSKVMQELIAYADANGKIVVLDPDLLDKQHGTTSQSRLRKFYKRFGFIDNKGRNKNYEFRNLMIRYPQSNESVNEGYKLQLERDADMMVLNITDTKTGKRTEVRGKSGYETNNYDANDKLHQLLDKISKSADISQLMNGEPVGINPKHPDGPSAKTATTKAFNEDVNIDNKEGWGAVPNNQEVDYFGMRVKMKPSVFLKLAESRRGVPAVDKVVDHIKNGGAIGAPFLIISYTQGSPAEIIGHEGRSRMIAIQQVFGDIPVEVHLFFNSDTVNRARHLTPDIVADINKTMMSQDDQELSGPFFTESINEKITKRTPMGDVIDDFYQSDAPQFKGKSKAKRRQMAIAAKLAKMDENFADGKVKGKSRPGRVKRAGASCDGSVTDLRARAKKYSGERAKMYHWCANMKSGKKK